MLNSDEDSVGKQIEPNLLSGDDDASKPDHDENDFDDEHLDTDTLIEMEAKAREEER